MAVLQYTNMHNYVLNQMPIDIQEYQQMAQIRTGFSNLDNKAPLVQGLYVLGAPPSLGKTTFMLQMCDQLAKSGESILYFSFEQGYFDFASKSISRTMYQLNPDRALSSHKIRNGNHDDEILQAAKNEYCSYSNKIIIVPCTCKTTIDDIEDTLNDYINRNHIKPIVVIDFLQRIGSVSDKSMSVKNIVDYNIEKLADIKNQHKIVIFAISSLNRENYDSIIALESFKESGNIEYAADVIWGLQLKILHDNNFMSLKSTEKTKKRAMIQKAMKAPIREIELTCLKQRGSEGFYTCHFNYHTKYDCFEAADEESLDYEYFDDNDSNNVSDSHDSFEQIEDDYNPFL